MQEINFSVCLIAKNEAQTIPKMASSLTEYLSRGGDVVLVDTGSTDNTVKVAKDLGFRVYEEGDRFKRTITKEEADAINLKIVGDEPLIVQEGDTLFDFASARNYTASLAVHDMVSMHDCDEEYSKLDIDVIIQKIKEGCEQFEYNFVYAHDNYGNETIKFIQSKFYNKKKMKWVGIIHEVLQPIAGEFARRTFLDEHIIKLEHWQNHGTNRSGYLKGLALDTHLNPENDRNSHYFARELMYTGHPKTALKEFQRHIEMRRWPAERAQSMIYMGDCLGRLNDSENQVRWYHESFATEGNRREALLRLAWTYKHKNDPQRVACYVAAALEIPWSGAFYTNQKQHYTYEPHELMYWAMGWLGKIPEAQYHIKKALEYSPLNSMYLRDLKYYFALPTVSIVIPTLGRPEGLKKCLDSIEKLNYPKELIEVIVIEDEPRQGVAKRLKEGVEKSIGDIIIYASNDVEFTPDSVILAYRDFAEDPKRFLVAFNTGYILPDEGNICEHFAILRDAIPYIDGEIFDTEFHHVGVDNLLWAKAKRLKGAFRSKNATLIHNHFTRGAQMDDTYKLGWSKVDEDRALLAKKLAELEAKPIQETPKFSLEYDTSKNTITGWMNHYELSWLYKAAKSYRTIVEIGSWMGRSTHALLSGCRGIVHAVDHFLGSADPIETGNKDVYPEFEKNVGHFKNLVVHKKPSLEGVKDFEDKSMEMVFIDAGHQYQEVKDDIDAWLPKATKLICGHDFQAAPVAQAVHERFGEVDKCSTIWYVNIEDPLYQLKEKIKNNENFSFVKMGDGEMNAMLGIEGENCDGHKYTNELGDALAKAYKEMGKNTDVLFGKWHDPAFGKYNLDDIEHELGIKGTLDHNLLLNRTDGLTKNRYNFWKTIKDSKRKKIFVGPDRLRGVSQFLNVDKHIVVPEKNAFDDYEALKTICLGESEDNAIFLFSAGMPSKVWISDLLNYNEKITCLDCGSAFDPLFVGQTRTNQIDQNKLKEFYAGLL